MRPDSNPPTTGSKKNTHGRDSPAGVSAKLCGGCAPAVDRIIETETEGLMNRHSIPNVRMLNEAVR